MDVKPATRLEATIRATGLGEYNKTLNGLQKACNLLHDLEGRVGIGPEFHEAYVAVATAHTMMHCASRSIIPIKE